MSTRSTQQLERDLHAYSVMVDYWSPSEGDSHLLIGYRERLRDASNDLTSIQRTQLDATDDRVLALSKEFAHETGWDAKMLRDTADLIAAVRSSRQTAHA